MFLCVELRPAHLALPGPTGARAGDHARELQRAPHATRRSLPFQVAANVQTVGGGDARVRGDGLRTDNGSGNS